MAKIIVAKLQLDASDCSNLLMAIDAYAERHKRQDENGQLHKIELHESMMRAKKKIQQALTNIQNAYGMAKME